MRRGLIRRSLAFVAFAFFAMTLGAGCLKVSLKPAQKTGTDTKASALQKIPFQDLASYAMKPEPPAEAPKDADVPTATTTVKAGETASRSGNVIVSSIVANQRLGNPFVIFGRARSFESEIFWRLRDARGAEFMKGSALTNATDAGQFGSFRARVFYDRVPETAKGKLEVFTRNPRDGGEIDLVSIPVTFEAKVLPIKVYFSNIKEDPQTLQCGRVYPSTHRIPITEDVAEASIAELLKGVTAAEQALGYRTSIFPGTILRSIALKDGVVTVDFSKEFLYAVSGSCHIQALSSQVRETLKQFPSVKDVKFLVEGQLQS